MSYAKAKCRFRALGLSFVAVLGLMGLMAVGASAGWLIEGSYISLHEPVAVSAHQEGNLLVAEQELEILCATVESENFRLWVVGTASGSVEFSECKTWQNGKEQPGCSPQNEPIVAGANANPVLHSSVNYVHIEPFGSGAFTTVQFNPAKCALVEDSEITGSLVIECLTAKLAASDCKNSEAVHNLRAAPSQALFKAGLSFGENQAVLDGVVAVELAGENSGAAWAGHI